MKMFIVGIISVIVLLFIGVRFALFANKSAKEIQEGESFLAEDFPNALYPIRVKGKWGYMNSKKEIVIDCKFDMADDFNEGFAIVEREITDKENPNGRLFKGFMDEKGTMITDFKYDRAYPFSDELAHVMKDGKHGYVDKTGKEVIHLHLKQNRQQ